jgi:hypothetical protein
MSFWNIKKIFRRLRLLDPQKRKGKEREGKERGGKGREGKYVPPKENPAYATEVKDIETIISDVDGALKAIQNMLSYKPLFSPRFL